MPLAGHPGAVCFWRLGHPVARKVIPNARGTLIHYGTSAVRRPGFLEDPRESFECRPLTGKEPQMNTDGRPGFGTRMMTWESGIRNAEARFGIWNHGPDGHLSRRLRHRRSETAAQSGPDMRGFRPENSYFAYQMYSRSPITCCLDSLLFLFYLSFQINN
jgi:hypothetical protein